MIVHVVVIRRFLGSVFIICVGPVYLFLTETGQFVGGGIDGGRYGFIVTAGHGNLTGGIFWCIGIIHAKISQFFRVNYKHWIVSIVKIIVTHVEYTPISWNWLMNKLLIRKINLLRELLVCVCVLYWSLERQVSHCSWLGTLFHCGGYTSCVWIPTPPPRSISSTLLDSGCPVVLYNKEHAYADEGDDIIHLYVRLLQIQLQQSYGESYSEWTKYRPFSWAPIKQISLSAWRDKQGTFPKMGKALEIVQYLVTYTCVPETCVPHTCA